METIDDEKMRAKSGVETKNYIFNTSNHIGFHAVIAAVIAVRLIFVLQKNHFEAFLLLLVLHGRWQFIKLAATSCSQLVFRPHEEKT